MILNWLKKLIFQQKNNQADNSSVVVDRDNYGPIFTGSNYGTVNFGDRSSSQNPDYEKKQIDDLIKQVTIAAKELVLKAKNCMQLSHTFVPIDMEIISDDSEINSSSTNLDEIISQVSSGKNIFFFGEGGIGKTTTVLELAQKMLDSGCSRIPVFMDAPAWSASKLMLLEYIVSLAPFVAHELTTNDLVNILSANKITFIINGWNEIPAKNQILCIQKIKQVTETTLNSSVILTARDAFDKAGLVSPINVRVKGLNWEHQKEFIRNELGETEKVTQLIERLALNHALRYAARNPLILTGIVKLQQHGNEFIWGEFNVFKAIVDDYEKEGIKHKIFIGPPFYGLHSKYLEILACKMNRKQSSALNINEARTELIKLTQQFINDGQLVNSSNPHDILQELCNHHLLFNDGNLVRFAHQRFQEYFVASHLIALLIDTSFPVNYKNKLLVEAINWPFWEDSLLLVAEKLAEDSALLEQKVTLIETAFHVDLCITCKLARTVKLQRSDNSMLFDNIVKIILQLFHSPVNKVSEFAITCMIDSEFEVFEKYLWPQLESNDQQIRLHHHRLGHSSISVKQLGAATKRKIMAWPDKRRAEFVTEVAKNPENMELLEYLATHDESDLVKAAAITAIAWDFPASEFALNAWKGASDTVKQDPHVLNGLNESLLEAGEDVRTEIIRLSKNAPDDKHKLSLALNFPDWLGEMSIDILLQEICQNSRTYGPHDPAIPLVRKVAPEKFLSLAKSLCLTKTVPDWAREAVSKLANQERSILFQNAWDSINYKEEPNFNIEVIGTCANKKQINMLIIKALDLHKKKLCTKKLEPDDDFQYKIIDKLLAYVSIEDLISIVLEIGQPLKYYESVKIIDLVYCRVIHGLDTTEEKISSSFSFNHIDKLIKVYWEKFDTQDQPQNDIQMQLCALASYVNTSHFSKYILECCKMNLDAWAICARARKAWEQKNSGRGQLPPNPYNDRYLLNALTRCGFNMLPGLRKLIDHPQAHHFVFNAIALILAQPWETQQSNIGFPRNMYGKNGKERRDANLVMLQPDPTLQAGTDQIANKLIALLNKNLQLLDNKNNDAVSKNSHRYSNHSEGPLLAALAKIPSRECLVPIWNTLARDDIPEHLLIKIIEILLNQGVIIEDKRIVRRIEIFLENYNSEKWIHSSEKWAFKGLNSFLYFVSPITLLDKPPTDYLTNWIHHSSYYEVIRDLKELYTDEVWNSLVFLARKASEPNEELTDALVNSLSPNTFEAFLDLLKDGTFFRLVKEIWSLKRHSGKIINVIENDSSRLEAFVKICSQSKTNKADALVFSVLRSLKGKEEEQLNLAFLILDRNHHDMHGIDIFRSFFSPLHSSLTYGTDKFFPLPCEKLRKELFSRALNNGQDSDIAKSLLSEIESSWRMFGRPSDEPRHPDINHTLMPWNKALANNENSLN